MLNEIFTSLDFLLFDRVFQPIQDWAQKTFHRSRRVLTGITGLLAVATMYPVLSALSGADQSIIRMLLPATILYLLVFVLFFLHLLYEEIRGIDQQTGTLGVSGQTQLRRQALFVALIAFPVIIALINRPNLTSLLGWLLAGIVTNLASAYFASCRD